MSDSRVAIRYAKSLLELAQEKNILEKVKADMELFAEVCKQNRDFVLLLRNPIIYHIKKGEIIKALFKTKVNEVTFSFFEIIVRKHREEILPAIADAFHILYNKTHKIIQAEISTATPLTDELRTQFYQLIKKQAKTEKIELKEKVDTDIIGGYILTIGDQQWDESLATRLNELKLQFSHNPYVKEY